MKVSFCGHPIRFTDAIPDRHLMCDGGVLWMGHHGVWPNVLRQANAGDESGRRCAGRLIELIEHSVRFRKSIEWSP
jgi:hypothetical protein